MLSLGNKLFYCDAKDCLSKNKLIRSLLDMKSEHGHHVPKMETLDSLREVIVKDDHPLYGLAQH